MDNLNTSTKSFWERPEGMTGMLTIGLVGLASFVGLKLFGDSLIAAFDTLITLLGQGLTIAVLGGALALLAIIVSDPRVRMVGAYFFKRTMWAITNTIITIDPIGVMKLYIEDVKKMQSTFRAQIDKLNGQIKYVQTLIARNVDTIEDAMKKVSYANKAMQKEGSNFTMKKTVILNGQAAGRREQANVRLRDVLSRMQFLHTMLQKQYELSDIVIANLTDEVEVKSVERAAIIASYSAMKTAKAILRGGNDKREMFDRAMEFVAQDYADKMGEIENFMTDIQPMIDNMDIENGVFEEEAYAKAKSWEERSDALLASIGGANVAGVTPIAVPVAPVANNDFNKFFKAQ